MLREVARWTEGLRGTRRGEGGFTLIELLIVMVIIGILAAIAVPTYLSQRDEAKNTAASAQLRAAATAQQLYYAEEDTYAGSAEELEDHGFRQGAQEVRVITGTASTYCMQAPGGGSATFRITEETGKPEAGSCSST